MSNQQQMVHDSFMTEQSNQAKNYISQSLIFNKDYEQNEDSEQESKLAAKRLLTNSPKQTALYLSLDEASEYDYFDSERGMESKHNMLLEEKRQRYDEPENKLKKAVSGQVDHEHEYGFQCKCYKCESAKEVIAVIPETEPSQSDAESDSNLFSCPSEVSCLPDDISKQEQKTTSVEKQEVDLDMLSTVSSPNIFSVRWDEVYDSKKNKENDLSSDKSFSEKSFLHKFRVDDDKMQLMKRRERDIKLILTTPLNNYYSSEEDSDESDSSSSSSSSSNMSANSAGKKVPFKNYSSGRHKKLRESSESRNVYDRFIRSSTGRRHQMSKDSKTNLQGQIAKYNSQVRVSRPQPTGWKKAPGQLLYGRENLCNKNVMKVATQPFLFKKGDKNESENLIRSKTCSNGPASTHLGNKFHNQNRSKVTEATKDDTSNKSGKVANQNQQRVLPESFDSTLWDHSQTLGTTLRLGLPGYEAPIGCLPFSPEPFSLEVEQLVPLENSVNKKSRNSRCASSQSDSSQLRSSCVSSTLVKQTKNRWHPSLQPQGKHSRNSFYQSLKSNYMQEEGSITDLHLKTILQGEIHSSYSNRASPDSENRNEDSKSGIGRSWVQKESSFHMQSKTCGSYSSNCSNSLGTDDNLMSLGKENFTEECVESCLDECSLPTPHTVEYDGDTDDEITLSQSPVIWKDEKYEHDAGHTRFSGDKSYFCFNTQHEMPKSSILSNREHQMMISNKTEEVKEQQSQYFSKCREYVSPVASAQTYYSEETLKTEEMSIHDCSVGENLLAITPTERKIMPTPILAIKGAFSSLPPKEPKCRKRKQSLIQIEKKDFDKNGDQKSLIVCSARTYPPSNDSIKTSGKSRSYSPSSSSTIPTGRQPCDGKESSTSLSQTDQENTVGCMSTDVIQTNLLSSKLLSSRSDSFLSRSVASYLVKGDQVKVGWSERVNADSQEKNQPDLVLTGLTLKHNALNKPVHSSLKSKLQPSNQDSFQPHNQVNISHKDSKFLEITGLTLHASKKTANDRLTHNYSDTGITQVFNANLVLDKSATSQVQELVPDTSAYSLNKKLQFSEHSVEESVENIFKATEVKDDLYLLDEKMSRCGQSRITTEAPSKCKNILRLNCSLDDEHMTGTISAIDACKQDGGQQYLVATGTGGRILLREVHKTNKKYGDRDVLKQQQQKVCEQDIEQQHFLVTGAAARILYKEVHNGEYDDRDDLKQQQQDMHPSISDTANHPACFSQPGRPQSRGLKNLHPQHSPNIQDLKLLRVSGHSLHSSCDNYVGWPNYTDYAEPLPSYMQKHFQSTSPVSMNGSQEAAGLYNSETAFEDTLQSAETKDDSSHFLPGNMEKEYESLERDPVELRKISEHKIHEKQNGDREDEEDVWARCKFTNQHVICDKTNIYQQLHQLLEESSDELKLKKCKEEGQIVNSNCQDKCTPGEHEVIVNCELLKKANGDHDKRFLQYSEKADVRSSTCSEQQPLTFSCNFAQYSACRKPAKKVEGFAKPSQDNRFRKTDVNHPRLRQTPQESKCPQGAQKGIELADLSLGNIFSSKKIVQKNCPQHTILISQNSLARASSNCAVKWKPNADKSPFLSQQTSLLTLKKDSCTMDNLIKVYSRGPISKQRSQKMCTVEDTSYNSAKVSKNQPRNLSTNKHENMHSKIFLGYRKLSIKPDDSLEVYGKQLKLKA